MNPLNWTNVQVFVAVAVFYVLTMVGCTSVLFVFLVKFNDFEADGLIFIGVLIGELSLLFLIVGIVHIDVIVTGFVNPEYGAIKEILTFVKH